MPQTEKKHPLEGKKLRRAAGQSLQEWIDEHINGSLMPLIALCACLAGMTCMAFFDWLFKLPPQPFLMGALCVGLIVFTLYRIRKAKVDIRKRALGLDGERWVGQYLEQFKCDTCDVFHDIQCVTGGTPIGNVDHLLVCDRGVFVIETKMRSKTVGVPSEIQYDGRVLRLNTGAVVTGELDQANGLRDAVQDHLWRVPGLEGIKVKAIVVYPGWMVKASSLRFSDHDIWVLNPVFLEKAIWGEPISLTAQQFKQVVHEIGRCQEGQCLK